MIYCLGGEWGGIGLSSWISARLITSNEAFWRELRIPAVYSDSHTEVRGIIIRLFILLPRCEEVYFGCQRVCSLANVRHDKRIAVAWIHSKGLTCFSLAQTGLVSVRNVGLSHLIQVSEVATNLPDRLR